MLLFPNDVFVIELRERDISIDALALHIGIERSNLSRRLSGGKPWPLHQYVWACEFLDLKPARLLESHRSHIEQYRENKST